MVKKIFKLFHSEVNGMHQAAAILGLFTLMSQVLALFRDRILASYFGATHSLDLYYASFRIPDFIFASVASLVSISVLIPFLSDRIENKKDGTKKFLDSVFTVFFLAIVVVAVIVFFLMPYIAKFVFPGITNPDSLSQVILLSRILLLQPICLGVSNMLGVITQIKKRFFLYAISPILYNLSIIFGIIFLYPFFGITGVVYGVVIGGFLHFIIQIPFVIRQGMLPRLTFKIDFKEVWKVVKISIPRTLTLSTTTLEQIFITAFASTLTVGSITIFSFAYNLQSVPLAIVGISYTLAAFPTLSSCFAKGQKDEFMRHIVTAARHIIFWSFPITALFIVLRAQIVRVILGSGSFNWQDTRLTAACLAIFTISLFAQSLKLLFIRSYYAAGKTKKPLFINLISSTITILSPFILLQVFVSSETFRVFFESLFKVSGIAGTEVMMLPLGYTIGTLVNLLMLWTLFERDFKGFTKKTAMVLVHSLGAGVIGAFFAYVGLNIFASVFSLSTAMGIFLQGFCAGIMGIIVTILIYMLLDTKELGEVWGAIASKVNRNNLIVSEPDTIEG
jgi:putative peptidoglycan lipid II flippase